MSLCYQFNDDVSGHNIQLVCVVIVVSDAVVFVVALAKCNLAILITYLIIMQTGVHYLTKHGINDDFNVYDYSQLYI